MTSQNTLEQFFYSSLSRVVHAKKNDKSREMRSEKKYHKPATKCNKKSKLEELRGRREWRVDGD